ncbi:MAG: hypothetical protein M3R69_04290 [Acidobacteriota bacterium]|nr:hypothetical protein [Acidobacteriota bacterium]
MNGLLILLYLVLCGLIVVFVPSLAAPHSAVYGNLTATDMSAAVLLCSVLAAIAGAITYKQGVDGTFLLRLFIGALLLRMLLGTAIFVYHGQDFFGGDAVGYDFFGFAQMQGWQGNKSAMLLANRFTHGGEASGSGMIYLAGLIYTLVGRNMLAIQLVNCVVGAATGVVVALVAHHVYNNVRLARAAGIAVAFYPSMVLWSCQGLKDGPTVFFLALSILATLKLGQKLSLKFILVLICSLLCVLVLRFYVFYMICVAVGGAFVIGMQAMSASSFARQFVAIIALGLALTYFGVVRSANVQYERYGNLAWIQNSRLDAAKSAKSGFGQDVDISTSGGALSAIPVGFLYLLLAPFPWQMASLRQSITFPEMVFWWACCPLLVTGLWFSVKHRLRMISPILIFTVMLSLAYSVVQGNVGTAYRQRAQLMVFYFIFVAVGFELLLEKREAKKLEWQMERRRLELQRAAATVARTTVARTRVTPVEPTL